MPINQVGSRDPFTRPTLIQNRARLEQELRRWFDRKGFLEITTPVILSHSSLEENIEPLTVTLHQKPHQKFSQGFLRVSPELSLKKWLTNFPKIFELGPCFRDLERADSPEHLNEFTLLEWYHSGITLTELIEEFIDLVYQLSIFQKSHDPHTDLIKEQSWNILTMSDAFRNYAEIDFASWDDWGEVITVASKRGFHATTFDDAFYWLFLNEVEPQIRSDPTIIYEYPIFQASFSQGVTRTHEHTGKSLEYGLRFEAYLGGMEICNGFQELLNPVEQKRRWEAYLQKSGKNLTMDEDFLTALKFLEGNKQPISGIAVGWERLLMFLLKAKNIRDIQPLGL